MLNFQRLKTLFYLNKGFTKASPTPICYQLSQFSLKYSTVNSDQPSFTVSYLINNCGFSPQTATKASKLVHFDTPQKPDSVIAFFRNHGFSDSQIYSIIRRQPQLLLCNPHKRVLPKFEFLLSKGASTSDIVFIMDTGPRFLTRSLENQIIPSYELLKAFLLSDKKVISCIKRHPTSLTSAHMVHNLKLLLDNGVTNSNIAMLLQRWPRILSSWGLMEKLEEIKQLEFDPLKSAFSLALIVKTCITKSHWDAKVAAFKSWGWSEENILEAFRKQPQCMLASKEKINAVMSFWVNQLGWSSLVLAEMPNFFGFSLQKRIIPRASVVKYLLSKGLRDKSASLLSPFSVPEKSFLEKYVKCFDEEETSHILKLYQEKMNL